MSDIAASSSSFVREALVPERAAPVKTTGFVGFLRTRLFNSPTNILLTIAERAAAVVHRDSGAEIPAGRCGLARRRPQCLPGRKCRTSGRRVLAVHRGEVHPVHLRILSGARALAGQPDLPARRVLLLPLLIPRLPAKGLNAGLFFLAFPVVAFFLLHGGGLDGFGVSWTAGLLSGLADSIADAGAR